MRRHKLVKEIFEHAELLKSNKQTIVFLLATLTDKGLTRFHKTYLTIKPKNKVKDKVKKK